MALLEKQGNPQKVLDGNDFTSQGELKTAEDTTSLVVGCAQLSEAYIQSKQYNLLWRDSDILFQSPRPLQIFEGSYILEPNVTRFTVAKVVNSIVPQLYRGVFFEDPPMILRPMPGTEQKIVDEKTSVMSSLLNSCQFKREVKWGLEQFAFLGTGIWKWGVRRVEKNVPRRVVNKVSTASTAGQKEDIHSDDLPKIEYTKKTIYEPYFEFRPIGNVLVDPSLKVPDIREAGYVIDVRFMNYYELRDLKNANVDNNGKPLPGWQWGEYFSDDKLKELWNPPVEAFETPSNLRTDQTNTTVGVVHHGEQDQVTTSADPLAKKLEFLDYVDPKRSILVLNRKRTIFSAENELKKVNYLSANWWNRPKAFYGMGLGLIVGQNQRVDQGAINSILKILSFGVNPVYLRARDSNSPTQMIRTSIGKIISVDGEVDKAYKLLEQPKVPSDVWSALQESQSATESASGADQTLVQGSSAGPRAGMGRNATGAAAMAQASATRLDGPLDNFLDQVFVPFLYILDELIFKYISDAQIVDILGEELGQEYLQQIDMNEYHAGKVKFEVLAGASLAAKKVMVQSLTILTQFMQNPEFNEYLADMGLYIDYKQIFDMYMMASEWKDGRDIVKPLTPQMEARRQAKLQQQQQGPMQNQLAINSAKADDKSKLEEQRSNDRIKNDLVRFAVEHSARSLETEATAGESGGFGDIS